MTKIIRSKFRGSLEDIAKTRPSSQLNDNVVMQLLPLDVAQEMCVSFKANLDTKFIVFFDMRLMEVLLYDLNLDVEKILFISDTKYKCALAKELGTCVYEWKHKSDILINFRDIKHIAAQTFYKVDYMPITNNLCVIGNPPYQERKKDSGGSQTAIYHNFVNACVDLNPKFISMIIPSRWMTSTHLKSIEIFRKYMATSGKVQAIKDFPACNEIFKNVDIAGGVCIFFWDRDGKNKEIKFNDTHRDLSKYDIIIRDDVAATIVEKVSKNPIISKFMNSVVSSTSPYGITSAKVKSNPDLQDSLNGILCKIGQLGNPVKVKRSIINDKNNTLGKWKVIAPSYPVAGQADRTFSKPMVILNQDNVHVLEPNQVCGDTYVVLSSFDTKEEAAVFKGYMTTKFVGTLLKILNTSQHLKKQAYQLVPYFHKYDKAYTDEDLYKMFDLNQEQISCIEQAIKI